MLIDIRFGGRHEMVAKHLYDPSILKYPWSSLTHYVAPRRRRPVWMEVDAVLGEDGLSDCASGRRRFLERMEGNPIGVSQHILTE